MPPYWVVAYIFIEQSQNRLVRNHLAIRGGMLGNRAAIDGIATKIEGTHRPLTRNSQD